MTKRLSEVVASTILKAAAKDPQSAFDFVLALVKENKKLRADSAQMLRALELVVQATIGQEAGTPIQSTKVILEAAQAAINKAKGDK